MGPQLIVLTCSPEPAADSQFVPQHCTLGANADSLSVGVSKGSPGVHPEGLGGKGTVSENEGGAAETGQKKAVGESVGDFETEGGSKPETT